MATIVVGVDGSASAQEALRFAVREARLRHARVRAVMAAHLASVAYAEIGGFGPDLNPNVLEESARAQLLRTERGAAFALHSVGVADRSPCCLRG